jgi:hypothetical protein
MILCDAAPGPAKEADSLPSLLPGAYGVVEEGPRTDCAQPGTDQLGNHGPEHRSERVD